MELLKEFYLNIIYHEGKADIIAGTLNHYNWINQACLALKGLKDIIETNKFIACLKTIIMSRSLGMLKVNAC